MRCFNSVTQMEWKVILPSTCMPRQDYKYPDEDEKAALLSFSTVILTPHTGKLISSLSLSLVGSSLLYKLRSHTANDNSTYFSHILLQNAKCGTSLVVEWLRIYLPMQDMGSIPRPEKFHMLQSNWAHVPQLLSSLTYSSCSTTTEATAKRRIAPTRCN